MPFLLHVGRADSMPADRVLQTGKGAQIVDYTLGHHDGMWSVPLPLPPELDLNRLDIQRQNIWTLRWSLNTLCDDIRGRAREIMSEHTPCQCEPHYDDIRILLATSRKPSNLRVL